MNLQALGWNAQFEAYFEEYKERGYQPGRVLLASREHYRIGTACGEVPARLTGRLRFETVHRGDLPAVGDWVAIELSSGEDSGAIRGILPRKSKFSRKVAGAVVEEQVIAANVDTVFLLNALDNDFNLRRMERYLTLARESGAEPVIVLSKSDRCGFLEERLAETASVAAGTPVCMISSLTGEGLDCLVPYLLEGTTAVLLGSSGAGKSTLLNRLLGVELQKVRAVRQGDDRGRHTTSRSDIFVLPGGALVIDTPGLRELQLWGSGDGLRETFEEIERIASGCRFSDCRHREEPGCAVREALQCGALDHSRFQSYLKLQREMAYLERSRDYRARLAEQARWKAIHKAQRKRKK